MGIKESIIEWRENKRARGRDLAAMYEYQRHDFIEQYYREKQAVKKNIRAMSFDTTMRDSMFSRFNEIALERQIMASMIAAGRPVDMTEFKRITRNRLRSVRFMRFQNGLPLVFNDYKRKYWVCPFSGYIPDDQVPSAVKDGVEFHTITFVMIPHRADRIVEQWAKRRHHGAWSMVEPSTGGDKPVKCNFMFEHFTDFVDFRFHYEDEMAAA